MPLLVYKRTLLTARHSHLGRAGSTNLASFTLHLTLQGA